MVLNGETNSIIEWNYYSSFDYKNPFKDVGLDILIVKDNAEWRVPAFWRGDGVWSVRFLAKDEGEYIVKSICSNIDDRELHNISHILKVKKGNKKSVKSITLSKNREFLLDDDSKPFFWFSDTWWMALSKRLSFSEFKELANYRKEQNFNNIQLVAGLFPDMDIFDSRAENEAGYVWDSNLNSVNPKYFDIADEKIEYLSNLGFIITIVGAWGYYLKLLGLENMKLHWRYIVARWGAYSTIWTLAGEATMPYYLSSSKKDDSKLLKSGWSIIAKYLREIDPYSKLITIHPIDSSNKEIDSSLIDINLIQASHNSFSSVERAIELLESSYKGVLDIPTIVDEINYEGILRGNTDEVQRLSFWSSVLNGSKGFGYGANGIWQVNRENEPFGASPSGASWGDMPFKDALYLKGAKDISRAVSFLDRFEWWRFKSKNNSLEPRAKPKYNINIAGIDDILRVIYIYQQLALWDNNYKILNLRKKSSYSAYFWNPKFKAEVKLESIQTDNRGSINLPTPPSLDEWVLVLELLDNRESDADVSIFKRVVKMLKKVK